MPRGWEPKSARPERGAFVRAPRYAGWSFQRIATPRSYPCHVADSPSGWADGGAHAGTVGRRGGSPQSGCLPITTVMVYDRAMGDGACYTIDDVVRLTGVSRRTVRFYVTSKLIPPPDGRGVGLHYWQEHVDGILRVVNARRQGRSLAAIARGEGDVTGAAEGASDDPPRVDDALAPAVGGAVVGDVAPDAPAVARVPVQPAAPTPVTPEAPAFETPWRGRFVVENRLRGPLVIPNATGEGTSLVLKPGQRVEVATLTPALMNSQAQDQISVLPV